MPTLLVSELWLKTYTPLTINIDPTDIMPFIYSSQQMWTQDTLGTNFLDHILNAYSAQTLTSDEIVLVDKLKPAIAYRAAETLIPFLQYRLSNKGPQAQFSDNSSSVGLEELRYLRAELRSKAEFFEERVKKYLCANGSLFPQYINNNTTDMLPESSTTYDSDIAFPLDRCNSCNGFYTTYGGCGCGY
jgi:hypothetical protein